MPTKKTLVREVLHLEREREREICLYDVLCMFYFTFDYLTNYVKDAILLLSYSSIGLVEGLTYIVWWVFLQELILNRIGLGGICIL